MKATIMYDNTNQNTQEVDFKYNSTRQNWLVRWHFDPLIYCKLT